jgi:hypothetical protein
MYFRFSFFFRAHVIVFGILASIVFLAQVASIFTTMELRGVITRRDYEYVDSLAVVSDYKTDPSVRRRWDTLQTEFSCCGVLNHNEGYKAWRNVDLGGADDSVPDSCCLMPTPNCGRGRFRESEVTMDLYIHTHGCLAIMDRRLQDRVVPALLGYSGVGVLLALAHMLSAVLAFVYAGQLSRAAKEKAMGGEFRHASHVSVPSTPKFDHVRPYYGGRDNLSSAFDDPDCAYGNLNTTIRSSSPVSQLQERPV